ncbi:MAG: prolipoprotein diacylglyceryl transferase [Lysobacterales bacterium]
MPFLVNFDPVLLNLGPVKIHWYGVMYLLGFVTFMLLGNYRARQPDSGWSEAEVSDMLFYGVLGVVLGGRLGYLVFYDFAEVVKDPHRIYQIWKGGMSFHGGLIGVGLAFAWFARKTGKPYHQIADFLIPMIPPGLFFGRIGNFIGGELWGRSSDVPWAMIFPDALQTSYTAQQLQEQYLSGNLNHLARHPSQLYEALLEGLLLFVIVWMFSSKARPPMAVTGVFFIGYGVFRSIVEWFREPDRDIGFIAGDWLTMGQILSWPLIIIGIGMLIYAYRPQVNTPNE